MLASLAGMIEYSNVEQKFLIKAFKKVLVSFFPELKKVVRISPCSKV
jgi:hypothetical protein